MRQIRLLRIASLLAMVGAGCSSSSSSPPSGSGGNEASSSGGSTQTSSGGQTGSSSGGMTGSASGGKTGTSSGGMTGSSSGGQTGSASGGKPGTSSGGMPGTASGGMTGSASGGMTGTASGGMTGSASGGMPGTASGGMTGASGGSTASPLPQLVTSASGAYWKTDGTWTESTGSADGTGNDGSASQTWEGFGGAFNEMGWAALQKLSEDDRKKALQLLFGDDGARFNMGRIPIGASDYACDDISKYPSCDPAKSRYTLDETANDTSLNSFSLDRDKKALIPYVQAALAIRPDMRLWASPWTPPTWMKTGMKSGNKPSPFDGGNMKSDTATLTAFAQYFVKFVQGYKDQNITVEAVAAQNEPNFDQNYPSCLWDTATYTKFVGQYLGPALDTAGMGTKIMLGTMSNGDKDPAIVTSVLGDGTAKKYVKMIGMQWGMKSHTSTANGMPIWQTEHMCGNYPFTTSGESIAPGPSNSSKAPNDQAYGAETWGLIRDWIKSGVTSYSAWNMVLDTIGIGIDTTRTWPQDSLLTVDTGAGKLNVTPAYYVFRHMSQFAQPGAKVVATSGGDAIAFKNPDGSLIAVMYNSGSAKMLTVAIGGKKLQFSMPGNGWATVNYTP